MSTEHVMPPASALVEEPDDRFYLDTSTIPRAGQGLFARVPLDAGARLEVVGVRVAPESPADRCSHYTDRYKFRMHGTLLIPLGYAAMVNHTATDPNMEKLIQADRLYLRAIRPIAAGEELLFTYGEDAVRRFMSGS